MLKNITSVFYKRFIALLLTASIIFVSFSSPAYADSSDPFGDGLKNVAGMTVGTVTACVGSLVFAPVLSPLTCFGAASAEAIAVKLGLRTVFAR